jgi:hypothetical protein
MKYKIVGEMKQLILPNNNVAETEATECEMLLWAEIERLKAMMPNEQQKMLLHHAIDFGQKFLQSEVARGYPHLAELAHELRQMLPLFHVELTTEEKTPFKSVPGRLDYLGRAES